MGLLQLSTSCLFVVGLLQLITSCMFVVGFLQLSTSCLFVLGFLAAHLMGMLLFVYCLSLDLKTSNVSLFKSAGILL